MSVAETRKKVAVVFPLQYPIGRGIVAALGIGYPVRAGDVAARLNFATRDAAGAVTDRRAGRIATELCTRLAAKLDAIELPEVEVGVRPVRDYRGVVILRGSSLSDRVADTDPQATGVPARDPRATAPAGERTAQLAAQFIERARELLADESPANEVLMRGFAQLPAIPSMADRFGLRGVAIAVFLVMSMLLSSEVFLSLGDAGVLSPALAAWGTNDPIADMTPVGGDGMVGFQDLLALLGSWGPCM